MNNTDKKIAQDVLEAITEYYETECSTIPINDFIVEKVNYTFSHLSKAFSRVYHITLENYINRYALIIAYEQWVKSGAATLTERSTVNGIKKFKSKFEREFDFSPMEAHANNEDMKQKMLDFKMSDILEDVEFVDDFKFRNSNIEIFLDRKKTLEFALTSIVLFFEKKVLDDNNYFSLSKDAKILFLLMVYHMGSQPTSDDVNSFEVSDEILYNYYENMRSYNVESPIEKYGYYYFFLDIHDELKDVFFEYCEEYFNHFLISADLSLAQHDRYFFEFTCLRFFNDTISLDQYAKEIDKSIEETKEILWDFVKEGFLRLGVQ